MPSNIWICICAMNISWHKLANTHFMTLNYDFILKSKWIHLVNLNNDSSVSWTNPYLFHHYLYTNIRSIFMPFSMTRISFLQFFPAFEFYLRFFSIFHLHFQSLKVVDEDLWRFILFIALDFRLLNMRNSISNMENLFLAKQRKMRILHYISQFQALCR